MALEDLAPHTHPFLCLDLGEGGLSGELRTRRSFPLPFHGSNKPLPEAESCCDVRV